MIDGRDASTIPIITFMRVSGSYLNIEEIALKGKLSLCCFRYWLCSETAGFELQRMSLNVFESDNLFDFLRNAF